MKFKLLMPLVIAAVTMVACGPDDKPDTGGPNQGTGEENKISPAHMVAAMEINTDAPIVGKEPEDYVNCTISIDHPDDRWDFNATGRIRGRGNSTWLWYDKKPYRIKLDEKSEIIGLAANKDWVLLANYRDPTHVMNTYVFEAGHVMGLPYTNHTRYVEVTLNGDYVGLYQLTEQIEQGGTRVDVDKTEGVLISLDVDDGPSLSPDSGDNFWSSVYGMPVCVKYPEDAGQLKYAAIRGDFGKLEKAVQAIRKCKGESDAMKAQRAKLMDDVRELLDVQSFIDYIILQELIYNVELAAPRSMYMHKDKGGKWVMGPLWDFDAGFDFDWGIMYTGHHYFDSYTKLLLGTDPIHHTQGNWGVPEFFTDLFRSEDFCDEFIARWNEVSPLFMTEIWDNTQKYIDGAWEAMERNAERWPTYIDDSRPHPSTEMDFEVEIVNLYSWLTGRIRHLDTVFSKYTNLE